MEWLKGFELNLWWNKLIAIGVAIIVAAVAVRDGGLILVALGMIAAGLGEGVNHKRQIDFTQPSVYLPQHMITSYVRMWHPFGVALDVMGTALTGWGLYRLLTA